MAAKNKNYFRAKEEAKRQQVEAELAAKRKIETEKAEVLAKKEAHRKKVQVSLPPEPPQNQGDGITKIRFRLPNGQNIERRFHANTPLQVSFYQFFLVIVFFLIFFFLGFVRLSNCRRVS